MCLCSHLEFSDTGSPRINLGFLWKLVVVVDHHHHRDRRWRSVVEVDTQLAFYIPKMDPYRARLLAIAHELTERDFLDLKFLCKDHFPSGILEKITRPLELFDLLERDNLLGSQNNDYLIALFDGINRNELSQVLRGESGKHTRNNTSFSINNIWFSRSVWN